MLTTRKHRARRVLLWALGMFAAIQVVASLLLDRWATEVRFPILGRQLARLRAVSTPDIICLGSSRTGSSIHDAQLTRVLRAETGDPHLRAFNCSVPVGDAIATEFAVRQILQRGIRPRLAVLELVPEEVARVNNWMPVHIHRQVTWADIPGQVQNLRWNGNFFRLVSSRLLPVYAFREDVQRKMSEPPAETEGAADDPDVGSTLDWSRILVPPQTSPEDVVARTRAGIYGVQKDLANYAVGGLSRAALERTLTDLRAAGVDVLLLGIPVASPHREQYTPEVERAFQDYLAGLTERFGVRYVDCRDALPDELFADHHHALPAGSAQFSQYFARVHLAPYWREKFGRP
jgi:hypothetical protein